MNDIATVVGAPRTEETSVEEAAIDRRDTSTEYS